MSSLNTAISAAASALDVQRTRLEVAISNLANSESTETSDGTGPYRRREVVIEAAPAGESGGAAGFGVHVAAIVEDESPFQQRFEPSNPKADENGYVLVPNVDVPQEMVDMLSAARAYQANLAAIGMIRDLIAKALELGRS